jgi:DNA primase
MDANLEALREAAKLISSIKDRSEVDAYMRELSFLTGQEPAVVRREVSRARQQAISSSTRHAPLSSRAPSPRHHPPADQTVSSAQPDRRPPTAQLPAANDRSLLSERDLLRLILQHPQLFTATAPWDDLTEHDFSNDAYRALFRVIASIPLPQVGWPSPLLDALKHPGLKELALQLSVEPAMVPLEALSAAQYVAKLKIAPIERRLLDCRSKLRRINPTNAPEAYQAIYSEIVDLEKQRHRLIHASTGE